MEGAEDDLRAAAERQLLESDLPALIDELDVGVIVQGRESEILYANQLALQLLGLRRDQVLGVTSFDPSWDVVRPDGTTFPPDDRPVARVLQSGVAERDVVLGVRRGGAQRHWLLANAIPHAGADGRVAYVVVTLSDISSERRRMNLLQQVKDELEDAVVERTSQLQSTVADLQQVTRALERSRGAFERVTAAVPGVLYQALRRHDGWIDLPFVSAYLRAQCGIEPLQAMNDPTSVLAQIHPEDLPVVRRSLDEATRAESTWECDVRMRGPDGSWRWIRNRAVPQPVPDGMRWSGVVLDVTEQRNLAEQIRLSQTREAIGAVTAGIAHNFNNALAVLVPNLEECLESAPEALRVPLRESLQTAFSAAALVRQLMVIARGGMNVRQEPVELVSMVRDVGALCRRIFQGRVAVSEALAETSVRVMGHAASIRQVLLNLCINARDSLQGIDGGTVGISLRVDRQREPPVVQLEVRDDGCGMDAETQRRLGEPFFTTKAPGEGTGLGLATAFATVRTLGGRIHCESRRGEGSRFTVELPVLDFGEERAPGIEIVRDQPASTRGRVLIIDDERLVRSALSKVLRRRGFEVDEAADGAEGLARVEAEGDELQVVLLDLSMPGISGERVLERLKHRRPELPVVILSGFIENTDEVASADAVLNKPLTSRSLVATLDRVLGAPSC